jgi:DNA (cytosine-5)-methyltransferase 1
VGYVERETYAAATLVARMEDAALDQAVVWDDVGTFDGRPWRGAVDIVTAGFMRSVELCRVAAVLVE